MCVYSMISDWGQHRPVEYWQIQPYNTIQPYFELLEKARKYDELMKQKDCPDPEKAKFEQELMALKERLEKLEAANAT